METITAYEDLARLVTGHFHRGDVYKRQPLNWWWGTAPSSAMTH